MEQMQPLKRIAAIHDISALGKCSLTVALPVVSATGVECACIPTALLSTHTGEFSGWTRRDLSGEMLPLPATGRAWARPLTESTPAIWRLRSRARWWSR